MTRRSILYFIEPFSNQINKFNRLLSKINTLLSLLGSLFLFFTLRLKLMYYSAVNQKHIGTNFSVRVLWKLVIVSMIYFSRENDWIKLIESHALVSNMNESEIGNDHLTTIKSMIRRIWKKSDLYKITNLITFFVNQIQNQVLFLNNSCFHRTSVTNAHIFVSILAKSIAR